MELQKRFGFHIDITDDFGHWLAGFVAGEGCFYSHCFEQHGYRSVQSGFIIALRADDSAILEQIKDSLHIGHLNYDDPPSASKPRARYVVRKLADLYHVIIPIFDRFPLRAKKATEFDIWKQIIEMHYHAMNNRLQRPRGRRGVHSYPDSFWDAILPLVDQLANTRIFSSIQAG